MTLQGKEPKVGFFCVFCFYILQESLMKPEGGKNLASPLSFKQEPKWSFLIPDLR